MRNFKLISKNIYMLIILLLLHTVSSIDRDELAQPSDNDNNKLNLKSSFVDVKGIKNNGKISSVDDTTSSNNIRGTLNTADLVENLDNIDQLKPQLEQDKEPLVNSEEPLKNIERLRLNRQIPNENDVASKTGISLGSIWDTVKGYLGGYFNDTEKKEDKVKDPKIEGIKSKPETKEQEEKPIVVDDRERKQPVLDNKEIKNLNKEKKEEENIDPSSKEIIKNEEIEEQKKNDDISNEDKVDSELYIKKLQCMNHFMYTYHPKNTIEGKNYYGLNSKESGNSFDDCIKSSFYLTKCNSILFLLFMYFPNVGDHVIGIITSKNSDFYTIDVGGLSDAVLPTVDGFRGATKRNRPNLNEGDVVFCQVICKYPKYELPIEVTCVIADDVKQWTTSECYFGQLSDGITFNIPISYAHSLSNNKCYILDKCGLKFKYEVAVGLNGRIWVKGSNDEDTLLLSKFLKLSYGLTLPQIEALFIKLTQG